MTTQADRRPHCCAAGAIARRSATPPTAVGRPALTAIRPLPGVLQRRHEGQHRPPPPPPQGPLPDPTVRNELPIGHPLGRPSLPGSADHKPPSTAVGGQRLRHPTLRPLVAIKQHRHHKTNTFVQDSLVRLKAQ